MAFHWQFTPSRHGVDDGIAADADPSAATHASFATQGDAETYLGEQWRHWAAAGITAVTLMNGATAVYDMSLLSD